ncbi:MAG: CCA tRNA nucleotidyltransferase [Chloroflexi bacterium]|nr:CCA tRNA nucleotidyltransferase [Chloroflexota bacterium]
MRNVSRLHDVFTAAGRQLFIVGGSVRERLLGRAGQDIDLATDSLPQETKELVRLANPDSIYTVGEKFGTIGVIFGTQKVEITTFRSEWYNPESRKPVVCFGTTLEEDLARRDFTVNAIAQEIGTGKIIDPFGGLVDLEAQVIRAVGSPQERFAEDPLRIMRAVRFSADLRFTIDPATRGALQACASTLEKISKERIAEETNKILLSSNPARGVRMLCDLALMDFVIPEVLELRQLSGGKGRYKDVFEHTLKVIEKTPPDLTLRWAALLHDIGKPRTFSEQGGDVHFIGHEFVGADMARRIMGRLRLSQRMTDTVSKLILLHTRVNQYSSDWTDGAVRRFIREAGDELEPLFALSRADVTSYRPAKVMAALTRIAEAEERCNELIAEQAVESMKSPLDGNELMSVFDRPPGPWIREVKEYLLEQVLEGRLAPDDKDAALRMAQEFLAAVESAGER